MISRIEAYNYRCFEKLDVELENFRVLVGANGSGKSTILDVVPLLSDLLRLRQADTAFFDNNPVHLHSRAERPTDVICNQRGNFFSLVVEAKLPSEIVSGLVGRFTAGLSVKQTERSRQKPQEWPDLIRYELQFETLNDRLEISQEYLLLFPSAEKARPTHGAGLIGDKPKRPRSIVPVLTRGRGEPATFITEHRRKRHQFTFSFEPTEIALANVPSDQREFGATLWFRNLLLRGTRFYMPDPGAMRLASPARAQSVGLLSNGSSLPWLIRTLRESKDQRVFRRWLEIVKLALPAISDIVPFVRNDDRAASFKVAYRGGFSVPASCLSDGTLQILAYTVLPYVSGLPPLVIIEEPENGVHPKAVQAITEALKSAGNTQIWMSTHSPIVLSNVELRDVLCLRQDPATGGVVAVPGPKHPALQEWKSGSDLATLFVAGVLS
jgi:AAA domain, putative AbiEii toxin, Type IV TA system/AAA ATPase domain